MHNPHKPQAGHRRRERGRTWAHGIYLGHLFLNIGDPVPGKATVGFGLTKIMGATVPFFIQSRAAVSCYRGSCLTRVISRHFFTSKQGQKFLSVSFRILRYFHRIKHEVHTEESQAPRHMYLSMFNAAQVGAKASLEMQT